MYCLELIQEVVETVIYTGWIRNENPVSIIIIGPSGIGKSMMLSRYQSDALRHTDSISSQGLFDISSHDPKNEVKFLLIPDMNPTLSRKPTTVQSTIANLLSFTSDGTVRIDDGRVNKDCKHNPVGIVTAATEKIYSAQAKKWFALGLRRRIIPIFFRYSSATTMELQALVREGKIHSTFPPFTLLDTISPASPTISKENHLRIETIANKFANLLGKLAYIKNAKTKWYTEEVVPIAPQITLINLAKAHALRDKRGTVNDVDISFLAGLLDFCDPERPKEI